MTDAEAKISQELTCMPTVELEALAGLSIPFMRNLTNEARADLHDRQYLARKMLGGSFWEVNYFAFPPTDPIIIDGCGHKRHRQAFRFEGKCFFGRIHAAILNWLRRNSA